MDRRPEEEQDDNSVYYNHYLAQAHANPELHGISGPTHYEHQRGLRQMNHYFDVNQMPTAIQATPVQAAPKPTAAQLQYFKEQREKKKRMKNKWLYE